MASEMRWTRTPEERAALVAKARVWQGTQREFAEAHGVSQPTLSRWLCAAGRAMRPEPAGPRSAPTRLGVVPKRTPSVPTMLQVVPTRAPCAPIATMPSAEVGVCLSLPGGAQLRFDNLPPPRWVAELAVELRRC